MDIPNVKMDISTMGDTEILDLFEQAFTEQVAEPNDIDDPEVEVERRVGDNGVTAYVSLYGMAGSPTVDTYGQVENIETVEIQRADKGRLTFRYVPEETRTLGGNEFQVVYISE